MRPVTRTSRTRRQGTSDGSPADHGSPRSRDRRRAPARPTREGRPRRAQRHDDAMPSPPIVAGDHHRAHAGSVPSAAMAEGVDGPQGAGLHVEEPAVGADGRVDRARVVAVTPVAVRAPARRSGSPRRWRCPRSRPRRPHRGATIQQVAAWPVACSASAVSVPSAPSANVATALAASATTTWPRGSSTRPNGTGRAAWSRSGWPTGGRSRPKVNTSIAVGRRLGRDEQRAAVGPERDLAGRVRELGRRGRVEAQVAVPRRTGTRWAPTRT